MVKHVGDDLRMVQLGVCSKSTDDFGGDVHRGNEGEKYITEARL